jgi:hypothetical protein
MSSEMKDSVREVLNSESASKNDGGQGDTNQNNSANETEPPAVVTTEAAGVKSEPPAVVTTEAAGVKSEPPPEAGKVGGRRSKRRRQKKPSKKSKKGGRSRKNGSKNRRKLSRRR